MLKKGYVNKYSAKHIMTKKAPTCQAAGHKEMQTQTKTPKNKHCKTA